jgi:hypothetical protein
MSLQVSLGVGPECYVSAVLSRSMFRLLELKIAHTGQSCMLDWFDVQDGLTGSPYYLLCDIGSDGEALASFTWCEGFVSVTDCAIDATSK